LIAIIALLSVGILYSTSEADTGTCGDGLTWTYDAHVLSITGNGRMDDYNLGDSPWAAFSDEITEVNISEGVSKIGKNAFRGTMIREMNVPDSVESIGIGAFTGCTELRSVRLGSSLLTVSADCFDTCPDLDTVVVSENNRYLFSHSNIVYLTLNNTPYIVPLGIKTVEIPGSIGANAITSGEGGTFFKCTKLYKITVSSDNTELRAYNGVLFSKNLSVIKTVPRAKAGSFIIPDNTTYGSFVGSQISRLTLGAGMKDISDGSLVLGTSSCLNEYLKDVNFGRYVTDMENEGAWYGSFNLLRYCPAIESVTADGNTHYHSDGNSLYTDDGRMIYSIPTVVDSVVPDGVVRVEMYAFRDCLSLETVVFPDSLVTLSDSSFYNCPSLTSIGFGSGLNCRLSNSIFSGCSSLTEINITGNSNYHTRSDGAVYRTENEKEILSYVPINHTAFTVTDDIRLIDRNAFENNSKVESITLSNTLESIAEGQFRGCGSLSNISIPSTVTSLGGLSFYGTAVTNVVIPSGVTNVGVSAFYGCRSLTEVIFEGSSTVISNSAFSNCSSLVSVTLPSSLNSIEATTFSGCASMESIDIPDSVTNIGNSAFTGCSALQSIVLPESLEAMGTSAFRGCTSVKSIVIKGTLTSIPSYAFYNCGKNSLVKMDVIIPSGITIIEEYAFYSAGIRGLTFPANPVTVEGFAFAQCPLEGTLDLSSVVFIGSGAFGSSTMAGIVFSDELTTIDSSAFQYCNSIIEISISSQLETLGNHAFYGCASLTTVSMDAPEATIGAYAFYGCTALSSADMAVKHIGQSVFSGDDSLTDVVMRGTETLGNSVFHSCDSLRTVALSSELRKVGYECFTSCPSIQSITVPSDNARFSTDGRCLMYDQGKELVVYYRGNSSSSYVIPESVKSFWTNAFTYSLHLTRLVCGASLSSSEMDFNNFEGCSILSVIEVSESNKTMKSLDGVVYSKDGTMLIYAPPAVTKCAFDGKTEVVRSRAFYGCDKLVSLKFSAHLTDIGASAFYGCTSITSINIQSVTSIGAGAFKGCTSLSRIVLAETGTISFGKDCFDLGRDSVTVCSAFEDGFLDQYLGMTKANYVSLEVDTRSDIEKVRDNTPFIAGGILAVSVVLVVAELIIRRRR